MKLHVTLLLVLLAVVVLTEAHRGRKCGCGHDHSFSSSEERPPCRYKHKLHIPEQKPYESHPPHYHHFRKPLYIPPFPAYPPPPPPPEECIHHHHIHHIHGHWAPPPASLFPAYASVPSYSAPAPAPYASAPASSYGGSAPSSGYSSYDRGYGSGAAAAAAPAQVQQGAAVYASTVVPVVATAATLPPQAPPAPTLAPLPSSSGPLAPQPTTANPAPVRLPGPPAPPSDDDIAQIQQLQKKLVKQVIRPSKTTTSPPEAIEVTEASSIHGFPPAGEEHAIDDSFEKFTPRKNSLPSRDASSVDHNWK